jgi:hypothetical protein
VVTRRVPLRWLARLPGLAGATALYFGLYLCMGFVLFGPSAWHLFTVSAVFLGWIIGCNALMAGWDLAEERRGHRRSLPDNDAVGRPEGNDGPADTHGPR